MEQKEIEYGELTVEKAAVYSAMRYGDAVPDEYVRSLVDEVLEAAARISRPKYVCGIFPAVQLDKGTVSIDGLEFKVGGIIGSYLDGMTEACVFLTTAGLEYNAYLKGIKDEGDIVKEFVADSVGSVIAEACVDLIDRRLAEDVSRPHTLPYSPGYCAWDIREQKKLFTLFPDEPCGVRLSDSCLMYPEKSVSGFFGIGETLVPQPYRCEVCTNKSCYKNRHK